LVSVIASPMRLGAGWNVSMGLRSHSHRTKRPFDPGNENAHPSTVRRDDGMTETGTMSLWR